MRVPAGWPDTAPLDRHRPNSGPLGLGKGWLNLIEDLHTATDVPVTARCFWLERWFEAYAQEWRPLPVLLPGEAGLRGVALLASRRRFGLTDVVAAGHGVSDYSRVAISDPSAADDLAAAIQAALRRITGPWRLRLEQLPADDPVARCLSVRLPHRSVVPGDGAPKVALSAGGPFGSAGYRQQVRMCRGRLERAGLAQEIRYVRDVRTISGLLPRLELIRRRRDHAVDRKSDLDDRAGLEFWRSVVLGFAERGQLDVATLALDGEVHAYNIGILDGATYRMWDHRFHPGLERYRLGQLLELDVIERAAELGFVELDRMRGVSDQKMRTASRVEPTEHLLGWSSGLLRSGLEAAAEGRRRLRTWRRSDPRVDRVWRAVKRATVLRGGER